ncbi:Protein of unknown function [Marivirga sericea]|uniref:DUF3667 domain-containing protein n=1 Tax=Marivirga sericea TaxID=1028 RepID=A0A1X7I7U4_9BACT|nr:DUF3667 domain-containing protein [Marivirga sericea]SMG09959.1 Protein of unknown function [Marivirga sericea]
MKSICKNCKSEVEQNYCPNCGRKADLNRINGRYIFTEITSVLYLDKGILYTIRELLIRPGSTIRSFIKEDRNRLVKPVIFIIICSLIYSLIRQILQFEDGYIHYNDSENSTAMYIFGWISDNYGYGNLIMGIFIALWAKVLFKKFGYNFFEILILLCFVMGIGMLILALFGIIEGLTQLAVLQFGAILFVIYATWAIAQFFDKKKFSSYMKAFLAYFLGMLTFTLAIILIGNLIDFLV